jgi:hypothetical protein
VSIAFTEILLREQMVTAMRGFPIKKLMPEQRRYVKLYCKECFRVGSITEPADRPRAEAAIASLYEVFGKQTPQFEWGPSPRWGEEQAKPMVRPIKSEMGSPLTDALENTFNKYIDSPLSFRLRNKMSYALGVSLVHLCSVGGKNALKGNLGYWRLAEHRYAEEVLSVPYRDDALNALRLYDEVALSCGWWWPFEEVCICTDRPEIIEWTDAKTPKLKRLRYRDGFEVVP